MGTRGGVSSSNKVKECDFGLGLRMQTKESCIVMSHSHHNEPSQLSSSSSSTLSSGFDGADAGAGGGGPVFYSRSNRVSCFGDIYDVVGAGSKSLQPFNVSSGEIAQSVNMRVPFTVAQWQELERQNIIYRYLMASVPVPPELLIPILRTQSNTSSSPQSNVVKGSLELGISGCNSDPEPWRCKRTDGKKWRCSRDVAPDQKYCERHSHKSRPRSRKPVEFHSDSMAMANDTNLLTQKSHFRSQSNSNFSFFSSTAMVSVPTSYDQQQPRNLEWFLKGETVPVTSCNSNSNQEWRPKKAESTKCYPYREGQIESNSNSYMGLETHRLNDNCSLLLSPKTASLDQTQAQETRHFLDVWRDSSNVGGIGNEKTTLPLPPSSLSLSMAGGGSEEIENGEDGCVLRPPGQWMSHGSWLGSATPGGPLAEALCLGISSSAKADSNFTSSHGRNKS